MNDDCEDCQSAGNRGTVTPTNRRVVPYSMKSLDDQPTLWEDDRREALNVLEQSRQQWMLVRRTQAIGTADEEEAWKQYRSASDRYWNVVHRT